MSYWLVYFIAMLDNVVHFFTVALYILSLLMTACLMLLLWGVAEEIEVIVTKCIRAVKYLIPLCIVSSLLVCFVPNTKQACTIYLLPKIANNERAQQVPDKALTLMNQKLDEWIQDILEKD